MKKTTLVIENVQPLLNCGRYPVKRVAGQTMRVSADVFKDGHDAIAVMLQWRQVGTRSWREIQMLAEGNDVWSGVFPWEEVADYEFTIEAWPDSYASWREEISRKSAGGANDLSSEALEGAQWQLGWRLIQIAPSRLSFGPGGGLPRIVPSPFLGRGMSFFLVRREGTVAMGQLFGIVWRG